MVRPLSAAALAGADEILAQLGHGMSLIVILLELIGGLAALSIGWQARDPVLSQFRPWPTVVSVLLGLTVLAAVWRSLRRRSSSSLHGHALIGVATIAIVSVLTAISVEGRFLAEREKVLAAEPERLAAVGRHLVVGYIDFASVRGLVERKAIGGIYISAQNVAGKSKTEVAAEIAALQAIRRGQGLPPLWISTDQEGGLISRLTPPLERRAALGDIVRGSTDPRERALAIEHMAAEQGRELARLGVTLNLAPVIDIDYGQKRRNDGLTRLGRRVIDSDPEVVASVASRYCAGLADAGVYCTLKHFPGLGRAVGDTHRSEVKLTTTVAELEAKDWVPFRRVSPLATTVVMVGHARATAIDAEQPASLSRLVISDVLRGRLGHEGLVITDDLCMGAIVNPRRGIGTAAVAALNAGADLVLLSWDAEQIFPVLAHLMAAERDGRLDPAMLAKSRARLDAAGERMSVAGSK